MGAVDNIVGWAAGFLAAGCFVLAVLLAALLWSRKRQRDSSGSTPQIPRSGNLAWVLVPSLAFLAIAVPSQRLLQIERNPVQADMTIEAVGSMWFWTYRYPDHGDVSYQAAMLQDVMTGAPRLDGFTTDVRSPGNRIVVPAGKTVRIVTRGDSVIYRWAIPSLGAEVDAFPGRANGASFRAAREGRYTSEYQAFCSASHTFIPLEIEVVSEERFETWLVERRQYSGTGAARLAVSSP
jgi:cytochrome c oxidase subunit 2